MGKRKIEPEEKVAAVQEYLDGRSSQGAIADRLGICPASFQMWIKNYRSMGVDAFTRSGNKHYSKGLKEQMHFKRSIFGCEYPLSYQLSFHIMKPT